MSVQIQSPQMLAKATHTGITTGAEWVWKPSELPAVFQKAKELKIASIGGNAQFIFPEGVCDLYWISIDFKDKADDETWEEYVVRSNDESFALLTSQVETTDFRRAAAEWAFVRERTLDKGIDPLDYLYYVIYFNSEQESLELTKWAKDSGFDQHIRPFKG